MIFFATADTHYCTASLLQSRCRTALIRGERDRKRRSWRSLRVTVAQPSTKRSGRVGPVHSVVRDMLQAICFLVFKQSYRASL